MDNPQDVQWTQKCYLTLYIAEFLELLAGPIKSSILTFLKKINEHPNNFLIHTPNTNELYDTHVTRIKTVN